MCVQYLTVNEDGGLQLTKWPCVSTLDECRSAVAVSHATDNCYYSQLMSRPCLRLAFQLHLPSLWPIKKVIPLSFFLPSFISFLLSFFFFYLTSLSPHLFLFSLTFCSFFCCTLLFYLLFLLYLCLRLLAYKLHFIFFTLGCRWIRTRDLLITRPQFYPLAYQLVPLRINFWSAPYLTHPLKLIITFYTSIYSL